MGKRSTVKGYWRAHGGTEASASKLTGPTPGVLPITMQVTVDAAAADGTALGKYLPLGAVITNVAVVSGHTGGTTPLLNIGLAAVNDAILNGVAADANVDVNVATATVPGASFGVALTADSELTAGTGGGTPGTGTSVAYITYVMTDDGSRNN